MGGPLRLVAIDVDGAAGTESLATLESEFGALPPTLTARTGRDRKSEHRLFAVSANHDLNLIKSRAAIRPGVDVRANGGYIVAAPSRHRSGRKYEWKSSGFEAARLPAAWFGVLSIRQAAPANDLKGQATSEQETARLVERERAAIRYVSELPKALSGKNGSGVTFEAAMAVTRGFDLPEESALSILKDYYNDHCVPPWSTPELLHKIRSARRDGRKPVGFLLDPVPANSPGSKPVIAMRAEEHEVIDEAVLALSSDASVYQRGGALVRVIRTPFQTGHQNIPPEIRTMLHATVRESLTRVAEWRKDGASGKSHPATWVVSGVSARGEWPSLRVLNGIVEAPTLRADGSVIQTAGYDEESHLLFEPSAEFPNVPLEPSRKDAVRASRALLEVFQDFPFEEEAHRSAALAALLTLVGRHAIEGVTPLFAIDGTTRGIGKGMLVDAIATIATGRSFARTAQAHNDEEQRKTITSLAIAGQPLVVIDNVSRRLGSPSLDAALTASIWEDRLLCESRMVRLSLRIVWMATGNNLSFAADTARRVMHIRLASPLESPEERSGFAHADLLAWVREERPRLLIAALTILRAYFAAGRPEVDLKPWGSFEAWSSLIRYALVWVGLPDPADTRSALMRDADDSSITLRNLLRGLLEIDPKGRGMLASEIIEKVDANQTRYASLLSAIHELMPAARGGPVSPRQFGMKLHQNRERVIDGMSLQKRDTNKGQRWFVARGPEGE